MKTAFALIVLGLTAERVLGCGLDWTLPHAHFDGVEEHGYISYWEKIGEVDLGDGLVIPVNINFNSHREASSPTLGKGWLVALLESHVEPINENGMNVIMPDGWIFTFLRNGSSETWRGNAGWVGETNNAVFTITAPCGWKIKFDQGKIQEIDSNKNRTLTYKYNGKVATEVDVDAKAIVQVDSNTATGVATDIVIGGQRINITQAWRPRVQTMLKQNLVTGFDQSLSQLQWSDGTEETFTFGTADKTLDPTLAIIHFDQVQRNFVWNPTTRQIKIDGWWTYEPILGDDVALVRTNAKGQTESYSNAPGITIEKGIDGVESITHFFASGILSGRIRSIEQTTKGVTSKLYQVSYDEEGRPIREVYATGVVRKYDYSNPGWVSIATSLSSQVTHVCKYSMDKPDQTVVSLLVSGQDALKQPSSNNSVDSILKFFNAGVPIKYNITREKDGSYTLE